MKWNNLKKFYFDEKKPFQNWMPQERWLIHQRHHGKRWEKVNHRVHTMDLTTQMFVLNYAKKRYTSSRGFV